VEFLEEIIDKISGWY